MSFIMGEICVESDTETNTYVTVNDTIFLDHH